MNYLSLVKKVCRRIGYAEPTTLASGLDSDQSLVAEWVADAWVDIQLMCQRWSFMVEETTVTVLIDKDTYTVAELALPTLDEWIADTLYLMDDITGLFIKKLEKKTEQEIKEMHIIEPETAEPIYFCDPVGGGLCLYPTPDKQYSIEASFKTIAVTLENDTDEPACAAQFYPVVYHQTMMNYSVSDNSPEDFQWGDAKYEQYMNRLDLKYCPQISLTGREVEEPCRYERNKW
ncbi:MAG: hypothetical protein KAS93_08115 [Gammaproteobacteria bacterium]|nr:hypothetical protein [Gammaproteobacteria bacterium]